jgi:OOP family OmpA-OmpF porin
MTRNRFRLFLLLTAAFLLLTPAALAEVRIGAVTLTPMVGYQSYDSNLDLEDAAAYGVALGYTASQHWGLELDIRYIPTEVDATGGPDVNNLVVTGNVLYHFMPEQAFVPYLVGGLGALQYDVDGASDDEDFILNWGAGCKYAVSDNVDLRLDLRHLIDFRSDNQGSDHDDDVSNNLAAMFGLNIQLGGTSNAPVKISR